MRSSTWRRMSMKPIAAYSALTKPFPSGCVVGTQRSRIVHGRRNGLARGQLANGFEIQVLDGVDASHHVVLRRHIPRNHRGVEANVGIQKQQVRVLRIRQQLRNDVVPRNRNQADRTGRLE